MLLKEDLIFRSISLKSPIMSAHDTVIGSTVIFSP